jgi:hypothetical protein
VEMKKIFILSEDVKEQGLSAIVEDKTTFYESVPRNNVCFELRHLGS